MITKTFKIEINYYEYTYVANLLDEYLFRQNAERTIEFYRLHEVWLFWSKKWSVINTKSQLATSKLTISITHAHELLLFLIRQLYNPMCQLIIAELHKNLVNYLPSEVYEFAAYCIAD